MPFVTEELWQELPGTGETIMRAPFPQAAADEIGTVPAAEQMVELISVIRNIRGENGIKPNKKIDIICISSEAMLNENVTSFQEIIRSLAGVQNIDLKPSINSKEGLAGGVGTGFEVFIDLSENIDVEQETSRLEKEKSKLEAKQAQINKKLTNEQFLSKAPDAVVEKNKAELAEIDMKLEKSKNLNALKKG